MNTNQNYVGGGNYASSIEQTAQNAASTGSIEVNTPGNILHRHWQSPTVEGVVSTYFEANSAADTIDAITKMLGAWLTETNKVTGELRNDLRTIDGANTLSTAFRLINLISEVEERNIFSVLRDINN
ncbi:hypothetical protein [Spirosoma jeollabukense]